MNRPFLAHASFQALEERVEIIETREQFVAFLRTFSEIAQAESHDWENNTLPRFLEALSGFSADLEGYYHNLNEQLPDSPTWKMMARMLLAARVYE